MSRTRERPPRFIHRGYSVLWPKHEPIQPPPLSSWSDAGSGSYVPETCLDALSPGPPYVQQNPLDLKKTYLRHYTASGKADRGYYWWYLRNAEMYSGEPFTYGGHMSPDLLYWETQALARSNPNSPMVDVPLFLFELREVPSMLMDVGNLKLGRPTSKKITKGSAEGFLAYNFGWLPFIGDLFSLMSLARDWEERARFLNGNRGRRTKVRLARQSHSQDLAGDITIPGYNHLVWYPNLYTKRDTLDVWATYTEEWVGDDLPTDAFADTSLSTGLGKGANPETLWNIVPWSWLIDYFANIGDVMASLRGQIPYELRNFSVMAHSNRKITGNLSETFGPSYSSSGLTFTNAKFSWERKQRRVSAVASPHIRFQPLLTGRQTAILGALATVLLLRQR